MSDVNSTRSASRSTSRNGGRGPSRSSSRTIGGTVRARAASELRDRILTGRLAPDTRLDLDQLSAEFGVSRTPLREALLELSYEGLVAVAPRSGITVVGLSAADAIDNFAVLATLEGKAAEWAAERRTEAQLDELRRLADAVFAGHDGADGVHVVEANRRFHRALNHASRSPRLLTYLRQAVRVVPASYFELFPEQERRSRSEHQALLAAVADRDGPEARRLAEAHVLTAGAALGEWLESHTRGEAAS